MSDEELIKLMGRKASDRHTQALYYFDARGRVYKLYHYLRELKDKQGLLILDLAIAKKLIGIILAYELYVKDPTTFNKKGEVRKRVQKSYPRVHNE